jgi:hypothetical protein
MLHIVKQSIPVAAFAITEQPSPQPRRASLKFLVDEVRTFRVMLDDLKQSQRVQRSH